MSEETTQNLPQDNLGLILVRLDSIDSRLGNVENRLSTLEDKVDRRLQETRPIWEQVLVRLDGVESNVGGLQSRVQTLEGEVTGLREEVRTGFHQVGRYLLKLSEEFMDVRADQRDLEKRMG